MGTNRSNIPNHLIEKAVLVFDICSSTEIVEDLHKTGLFSEYERAIGEIREFLTNNADGLGIEIYKFLGDGFIVLFDAWVDTDSIIEFSERLITFCNRIIANLMGILETNEIRRKGITVGIDKGQLFRMQNNEYVGRPINLACRLQSSLKDPDQTNRILMSVRVYSEVNDLRIKDKCILRWRSFRNISKDRKIRCYEYHPFAEIKPAAKIRLKSYDLHPYAEKILKDALKINGEIHVLSSDQTGDYIVIGEEVLGKDSKRETTKYLEALQNLVEKEYVIQKSEHVYHLTSTAYDFTSGD